MYFSSLGALMYGTYGTPLLPPVLVIDVTGLPQASLPAEVEVDEPPPQPIRSAVSRPMVSWLTTTVYTRVGWVAVRIEPGTTTGSGSTATSGKEKKCYCCDKIFHGSDTSLSFLIISGSDNKSSSGPALKGNTLTSDPRPMHAAEHVSRQNGSKVTEGSVVVAPHPKG